MSEKFKKDKKPLQRREAMKSPLRTVQEKDKSIRQISPVGMRVLVQIKEDDNQTQAGLYLPEGAKEEKAESVLAHVIEVASAHDEETEEEENISGIPLGALVLIEKESGVKVPWDDSLRLIETADVLAIVHELSLS